jgi:N-acetylmuramoyl-L-alanine amidase
MKICLDAGHGGRDPGATFGGLDEKVITLEVAGKMGNIAAGTQLVQPVYSRPANKFVGLRDRVTFANESGADVFVSLHCNADADEDNPGGPEASGMEIYHAVGSIKGLKLATAIGAAMREEFPDEPWRGVKARDLYVVKRTVMPAVLVEMAFIDNSSSNLKLRDPSVQRRLAFSILGGVIGYWL